MVDQASGINIKVDLNDTEMKTAVIIDVYSRGSYHEVINLTYLMMIAALYDKVTYIAASSSCAVMSDLLHSFGFDKDNITFVGKTFAEEEVKKVSANKFGERLKYSWLKYYYYMKQPSDVDVFYNNGLFLAISLISWFSFGKRNKVFSLCHTEMEVIDPRTASRFSKKVSSWYFGWIFRHTILPEKFTFILLSDNMKEYFRKFISPRNADRIQAIEHPYLRLQNPLIGKLEIPSSGHNIKIGLPSSLKADHGIEFFRQILQETRNSDVTFYAISLVAERIVSPNFVDLGKKDQLLDYNVYSAYINCMDFLLFPYDIESYKLTASGAFLEAIWNNIPIIALHNNYFDSFFKKYGPMGYLFDNKEDMIAFVNNRIADKKECTSFRNNMKKAKDALHPERIKEKLQTIIEQS